MKTILLAVLVFALLDQTSASASNSSTVNPSSSIRESLIAKEANSEALDKLVREYVKAVQSADSVDALSDYLPSARVKKLKEVCTSKERAEWLQFRKAMPAIVKLTGVKLHKDKAVLTYQCPDAPPFFGGNKVKKVAHITLVRESGSWKIAMENFAPEKTVRPSNAALRT